MSKVCTLCDTPKDETKDFYADKRCKDGLCSHCKECDNKNSSKWRKNNPERNRKMKHKWYTRRSTHVKRKAQQWTNTNLSRRKEIGRNWASRNADVLRDQRLKRTYGITVAEYEVLRKKQRGRCAICSKPESRLHIDHCHKTRKYRGLLCSSCNLGLGLFKDDTTRLQMAIAYLQSR